MINKEIIINKKTREIINGENGDLFRLGVDGENLQENIVFKFDDEFVNGTARIEITMQDNTKSYVMINKVNQTYVLPVKSILTKTGLNKMQLVITQGTDDQEIPIFKSKMFSFFIADSINADTEQPEEYPQWIDKANTTLNEIDNFDIDAVKELNEATITITDRYGLSKSVQVYDGENGQDGKDAKINGVNTLRLLAGNNITLEQEDDELTINAEGGSAGAVSSVNGMTGDVVIEIPDVSDFITKDVNNLTNYELKSTTANNLLASIDSSTYVMTLTLRNSNNETLNSQTIDLPLETMVVNGSYDSTNKKIILTLKNGNTIEFSVADLVSGLQSEITSSNKLDADLVDDSTSTNKFTNATEKATWNAKSDFSGDYDDLTNKPDLSSYAKLNDINFSAYPTGSTINLKNLGKGIVYFDNIIPSSYLFRYYIKDGGYRREFNISNVLKLDKLVIVKLQSEVPQSSISAERIFGYLYYIKKDGEKYYSALIYNFQDGEISTISEQTSAKVDEAKIKQYNTMPTASANYLNQVAQYIGTTDSTYTNSYFYKCVNNNNVYSWENINIQNSGSSFEIGYNNNSDNNPFNFSTANVGHYKITQNAAWFSFKVSNTLSNKSGCIVFDVFISKKLSDANNGEEIGFVVACDINSTTSLNGVIYIRPISKYYNTVSFDTIQYIIKSPRYITSDTQTFDGVKTFSSIPQVSSYTAPTQDTELTAKKYVDDSISNKFWIGTQAEYDAITTKDANVLYFIQEV